MGPQGTRGKAPELDALLDTKAGVKSRLVIAIRPLGTQEELAQGVAIQRETWGQDFTECVPTSMLQVSQKVGGIAAGAFDPAGHMVGFIYGLTGARDGRLVHWSHMLAVRSEARGAGLGKRLKLYQREVLLGLGVEEVRWTFDPLVAQNAHVNLNDLGAEIESYVPEMYGSHTGSDLHSGLGTDRFIALWRIADARVARVLNGKRPGATKQFDTAPVVNSELRPNGSANPVEAELPSAATVRIEIPEDIQQAKSQGHDVAVRWRATTRRAFLWYLERGYRVTGFRRDPDTHRCFYLVARRRSRRA